MSNVQALIAANLTERADHVTCVSNNVYARYIDNTLVLKVICEPAAADELRITLVAVTPERGAIDAVTFAHTRAQKFAQALEELDAFMDIWFPLA
ncbi:MULTISPECIES: hypothetical protein [unclassified Streptomyces]|uniref:hypothetical protein n=1 Tax=unclassified Streptomyces TaxID=2593676 RepID=UPI0029B69B2B|nr:MULTISPECIES: hypothetical protein [unclassified Streptomyces]MDX3766437.1 hypothetical protein [Streptomyces sp. AK08-01B]MDX3816306.1 hypothetical protein [Streptomyces sp. AK08-01A]